MKETIQMVLAAFFILAMLYVMVILETILEDYESPLPFPEGVPQERWAWPNLAGYGLPPETEPHYGLFY